MQYFWEGDKLSGQSVGGTETTYIFEPDAYWPTAIVTGSGVQYVHVNHVAVPVYTTDSNGDVVWQGSFGPYGDLRESTGAIEQPFGLLGHQIDTETGLDYNRFRYYDSLTGRFLQPDPLGSVGGLNAYTYATLNPISRGDPFGLGACYVNFPDYPISVPSNIPVVGGSDLPLGHAGVLGYDETTGRTRYYEYGRYDSNFGEVKRRTIPDLEVGPNGDITEESWEKLKESLQKNQGKGTPVKLHCDDSVDEDKVYDYAEEVKNDENRDPYSWNPFSSNQCKDFARRAIDAGR